MMWGKQNKYSARKCEVDGITFASRHEAKRYRELRLLEKAGEISNLNWQVKFDLLPSQHGSDGKVIERGVQYIADFTYFDKNNEWVVEDAKGCKTGTAYAVFVLKRKMMLYFHGIKVVEV